MHKNANQAKALQGITKISYLISFAFGIALLQVSPAAQAQDFDTGVACPTFPLRLTAEGGKQVFREFQDRNGRGVRTILAGKGSVLTFTNLEENTSVSFKTGGSVLHQTNNPDGTSTITMTGHNGFIYFPEDKPVGPSTILYFGRAVLVVNTQTFILEKTLQLSGKQVDICALLAS